MKFLKMWPGIKRKLSNMALGISGRYCPIVDISPVEDQLGYTSMNGSIHLAYSHPIMDELPDDKKVAFVYGVFAHELMHKLETDFPSFYKEQKSLSKFEVQIYSEIYNIMEDAAIEYWAPHYYGSALIKPLRFMSARIYSQTPPLEECESPFAQFIRACIQYGDGGFLKGRFTFPDAEKVFFQILPIMDQTTTEPDGAKRVQLAKQVFSLSKPLWIHDVENAEKFAKMLEEYQSSVQWKVQKEVLKS